MPRTRSYAWPEEFIADDYEQRSAEAGAIHKMHCERLSPQMRAKNEELLLKVNTRHRKANWK